MNPCMDCHALMFKLAGEIMRQRKFDFLFSGEVLGQRPMSQRRDTLNVITRDSATRGVLLRPLSARLMDETEAERAGLVDREKLLDFSRLSEVRRAATDLAELVEDVAPYEQVKLRLLNGCHSALSSARS